MHEHNRARTNGRGIASIPRQSRASNFSGVDRNSRITTLSMEGKNICNSITRCCSGQKGWLLRIITRHYYRMDALSLPPGGYQHESDTVSLWLGPQGQDTIEISRRRDQYRSPGQKSIRILSSSNPQDPMLREALEGKYLSLYPPLLRSRGLMFRGVNLRV